MPLGKYYCDYCDKQFQDTAAARRRHLQGSQHQRARALWYDTIRRQGYALLILLLLHAFASHAFHRTPWPPLLILTLNLTPSSSTESHDGASPLLQPDGPILGQGVCNHFVRTARSLVLLNSHVP
jgi:U11/U12 small nuclear ribonucleoprotein SNRNP20